MNQACRLQFNWCTIKAELQLQHLNSTEWSLGQLLQGRWWSFQPWQEESRGCERWREARRRFWQHCRRQSRRRQGFSCQVQTNFTFLIRGRVGINTPLSTQHLINTPVVGPPLFDIIGTPHIFGIPFLYLLKLSALPSILGTPSFLGTPSIDTIGTTIYYWHPHSQSTDIIGTPRQGGKLADLINRWGNVCQLLSLSLSWSGRTFVVLISIIILL